MDIIELSDSVEALLAALKGRTDEDSRNGAYGLLRAGEEMEAVDVLIATLLHDSVEISSSEAAILRQAVDFLVSPRTDPGYSYLTDPTMLDRLRVRAR